MKLKIRTLSPLFIGSGEDYNGISYIVDGNRIKFYDLHGIMGDMSQQQEKEFISFIERHGSRSSLKRLLREVFGAETCPELDSHCIYKLPAAGKVDDGRTIRAFIAEGKNAYIPGTEIKGAIRTAVLYYLLNPDLRHKRNTANLFAKRLYDSLATLIEKRIQGSDDVPRLRDIERELEGVVFRARGNMEDARYDVFKGLLIRDSEPKPAEGCLFVSSIKLLNVHRRKTRRSGRIAIPSQLCCEGQAFVCEEMQMSDNSLIASQLGFSDNQRWMLQFTDDLPNFFECCYEFSRKLLQKEIDYFNRKDSVLDMHLLTDNLEVESEDEAREILDQVVGKLEEIQEQNKPGTPVIRLGGSQGYFSTTISLILKERDTGVYQKVVRALEKRTPPEQFPRTRRLVLNLDCEYDTLGWVQLSTNSD